VREPDGSSLALLFGFPRGRRVVNSATAIVPFLLMLLIQNSRDYAAMPASRTDSSGR
jgi:low affinity Fe/Cu permease